MHAPETKIYYAVLIGFLIFGSIVFLLILTMVKQHKRNIVLYKSKIAAEISTLENERKRIAADLHDDLGPMLSAVKFKLQDLETADCDIEAVRFAEDYIDDVVQKLRVISNDLMPTALLGKGIVYAIEEFIQRINNRGLSIEFTSRAVSVSDEKLSVNLYRIILEIVHNALKHSQASNLQIDLGQSPEKLILRTKDNGRGFDAAADKTIFKGLGLRNILSRTELLGGEMFLDSSPGEGTEYTITLPLKK